MAVDTQNLEVGAIYEIDPTRITPRNIRPLGLNIQHIMPLRNNNIKYIRILKKLSNTNYGIMPLDNSFNDNPLTMTNRIGIGANNRVTINAGRWIDTANVPIIRRVKSPSEIGETELNKQRGVVTQDILEEKGIPATKSTGPLGNILEMAGIKTPKSKFGGKTRKGKKPRKSKKTRKH